MDRLSAFVLTTPYMEEKNNVRITDREGRKHRHDLFLRGFILISMMMILGTRLITITHNMQLHPDEHVFFRAADSLTHFLGGTEEFIEVKEYPEGAIVLQLPFHAVAAIIRHFSHIDISLRLCSRLASVFYFTLGGALGIIIEYKFFGKNRLSAIAYSVILIFSIIHIEQSRYGTGDAISLFLTMGILYLSVTGEEAELGGGTDIG